MICGKIEAKIQGSLKSKQESKEKNATLKCEQTGNIIVIVASHMDRG